MFDKLKGMLQKFEDLERQMADPVVIGDSAKYQSVMKEYGSLEEVAISYVDIPLAAPNMHQAVRLFIKGEQAGYSSVKDMYILFQSILRLDIEARTPEEDGLDVYIGSEPEC